MVYTNCQSQLDLTFDHQSLNLLFGFQKNHVMPYICIDNPLVYTNKVQAMLKKQNDASWNVNTLKSLMLQFESSAEELHKLFGYLQKYEVVLTNTFKELYDQLSDLEAVILIAQNTVENIDKQKKDLELA